MQAGRVGGLATYELFSQYQELTARMFGGHINFTYNPVSKKLTIVRKVNSGNIQGEYVLKNTGGNKKKIIFSSIVWYDPETKKYDFKTISDLNGNLASGDAISYMLIQDLLSLKKWQIVSAPRPIGSVNFDFYR